MPTVGQIAATIEEYAPRSLACPWDNVGLQVGNPTTLVQRVLVAVDVSDAVVAQAVARGVELIVSHHPLIFDPLRAVVQSDGVGARVGALLRDGIALYAAHTNLDAAPRLGTAQALAEALGLVRITPLVLGGEGTLPPGPPEAGSAKKSPVPPSEPLQPPALGRLGEFVQPMTALALARHAADLLGTRNVRLYGAPQQALGCVAVVPGAGGEGIAAAAAAGAGALLTGELSHHEVLAVLDQCMVGVSVGHLASERPVREVLARELQRRWPDLVVLIAEEPPLETYLTADAEDRRLR